MASTTPLPLPAPFEVVSSDPELAAAWESVNHWWECVMKAENVAKKKRALKSVACHIQLACKSMSLRLKAMTKDAEKKPMALKALRCVVHAAKEVAGHAVVQDLYRYGPTTSFEISVNCAEALSKQMSKRKTDGQTRLDQLKECERIWRNIALFNSIEPMPGVIKAERVRDTLSGIKHELELLEASPRSTDESSSKRARRRSPSPKSQPTGAQITRLLKFDAGVSQCLKFVDSEVGQGEKPAAEDLFALATGKSISDRVVDSYMMMLCHFANSRSESKGEAAVSPEWHAWSAWTLPGIEKGNAMSRAFPPKAYPQAQLGDVHNHLFPIHLENHWGMAVLSRCSERPWRLIWYSSLPGYRSQFDAKWAAIAGLLASISQVDSLTELSASEPSQPQQTNEVDCGVFILAEARWVIMGWPLETLTHESIPFLRRLMTAELETGHLVQNEK